MSEPFPHLFEPLRVGSHTLKNRIIMGSMHSRFELLDKPFERQAAFYAARAAGGASLIVTGGYSPNAHGRIDEDTDVLDGDTDLDGHRHVTDAVHGYDTLICAQILHAGRYAKVPQPVGASTNPSPINRCEISALTDDEVDQTILDYVNAARVARDCGYDGVEIMGSEGYLLTQFLCLRTNDREGRYGGSFKNRMRLATTVVRAVRAELGAKFIIIFRLSAIDLVEGGLTGDETVAFAQAVAQSGADMLSSGIGWHEARVPTIAHMVPRGAWRFATARLTQAVDIPVAATNRINTPDLAEDLVASGDASLVALARPFLADPAFAAKAQRGEADQINTCIACNQACLDYIFANKAVSCLVNPFAGREYDLVMSRATESKRIAVVGSGAAGLATAVVAAERGLSVTLFERDDKIGGQLNLAAAVPGKEDFLETLRYFRARLDALDVAVKLNTAPDPELLQTFDEVVVATGVVPRRPEIDGINHKCVAMYNELLDGSQSPGKQIALIGAGGIGFDVAEFLSATHGSFESDADAFLQEWSVDATHSSNGGLLEGEPLLPSAQSRTIWMLQRSAKRFGKGLALTTGWTLKAGLARRGVSQIGGVRYERIDDDGLHLSVDGETRSLKVDQVVICAGQEPNTALVDALSVAGVSYHVIGGAERAEELDALRAIEQGTRLALSF